MQVGDGVWSVETGDATEGTRYGLRADGPWSPEDGLFFDPAKLLVDPYATQIDRPFRYDARLSAGRSEAIDTAFLTPKAILRPIAPRPVPPAPPRFRPGGFIYEVPVKAFTCLHPEVPERLRGTVAALADPAIIAHLVKLGVDAVELMPITAWIDERHLQPLGLRNAWGYNPVAMMALDPRICPGGIDELRVTVAALHDAGVGVILDLVLNHTGESDIGGPTLSMRGLDNRAYYRHDAESRLVNDTGCGNTLACDHPATRRLLADTLRHFVTQAGVDGFRFDLATVLGRTPAGFDPDAPLLRDMRQDPVLADRILIAEPWDVGPGGYRLGEFGAPFLEWNDRFRDKVRRFWRGEAGMLGEFATALAGSQDVFAGPMTRTVNFIAAHDGFTLADVTAYRTKRNLANGEEDRDGHDENHSWNNGVDGPSEDEPIAAARRVDVMALLGALFASRGTIMLTAGDEFGRSQKGNNNAYAQDNEITWLDWRNRDADLEAHCARLSAMRHAHPEISDPMFLRGLEAGSGDVTWLKPDGSQMAPGDWTAADALAMALAGRAGGHSVVLVNRTTQPVAFDLSGLGGARVLASRGVTVLSISKPPLRSRDLGPKGM